MKSYISQTLRLLITGAGLFSCILTTDASPISVEAGVTYTHISGTWSPHWSYAPSKNDTSNLAVPFLRFSYALAPQWQLGLSYSYYSDIGASGATGNAPLEAGQYPTGLIFPAWSKESIHEAAVDLRYSFSVWDKITLEVGPVLSTSFSKLDYWQQGSGVHTIYPANNGFHSTRLSLGGVLALRVPINERWNASLSYRYAEATGLTLQHFGAALAYRF